MSVNGGGSLMSGEVTDYSGSFELVKGIAEFLLTRTDIRPKIGLVCGSGMGSVASLITSTTEFSYEDIPHFPRSTVPGHAGKLIFGYLGSVQVMCMQGRVHFYEGYEPSKCVMPVRVMKMCGVTHLIMSNAAGGVNESYTVGDIMIMKDHVNFLGLSGVNPLRGRNDPRWGPRFVALNQAYSARLRAQAKDAAKELGISSQVHEGVYAMVGGPNFETVAEVRMLRILGIDAVGMSTAQEAIAAHHCGLTVFAFSLITNVAVFEYETRDEPNHEDNIISGKKHETMIKDWVTRLVEKASKDIL